MEYIQIENEVYYKIGNSDALRPFFMSIVSDSNHWMFISSNGGLSAGRKDSDNALFPYYTDDKITESYDLTGSKSIFQVVSNTKEKRIWEPFSNRYTGVFSFTRNLYKSEFGNKIIFEEINHDLGLTYRYQWSSSNRFGFVRKSKLVNHSGSSLDITILDGIQNIMPYGVGASTQQASSNLVDAYKRSELLEESGLGIFALSAIIVDKAEPSEALKANVVWSLGLDDSIKLLSSKQLDHFRNGDAVEQELDIKAEKGAYFSVARLQLEHQEEKQWALIADVNKSSAKVISLSEEIKANNKLWEAVFDDVALGTKNLLKLTNASDGKQLTSDQQMNTRHYSNVLFNIMRGGIFDDNYTIEKNDFITYISKANKNVFAKNKSLLNGLSEKFTHKELKRIALQGNDADFRRLCLEYLPLKFSRRHGDPSRPWNKFSINTRTDDGRKVLDYEGNWRDIFQNWEALALSYPDFLESMIYKFLNASTFDGYNPYRVTKDGFDWEIIEPDDPWSYIGYWGDHQIIYLLKLLELMESHYPNKLGKSFFEKIFVYANVPYKIKSYQEIVENPKDTILFDEDLDRNINKQREKIGADAALLSSSDSSIYHVTLLEKLLATVLSKMSNFIPEGGIWMNTQRPEWNDANNALVGNGVSMVTLYYLHRFMVFFDKALHKYKAKRISLSNEFVEFYHTVREVLETYTDRLDEGFDDIARKEVIDEVGQAASDYRLHIYKSGFWGKKRTVSIAGIKRLVSLSLAFLKNSIEENKRPDGLYHAYNLLTHNNDGVKLFHLDEMLEGQVAALSSGYLSSQEALGVLDAMRSSPLFRPDQYSYILYPNKKLPGFMERNVFPPEQVESFDFIQELIAEGNEKIIEKDPLGEYHFNGNFKNVGDLQSALDELAQGGYQSQVQSNQEALRDLFEQVFNHKAFTGRSGTFYAYEGLGSIYWHMVSKLLLAAQECCLEAIRKEEDPVLVGQLLDHYYEIQAGIGVHKAPKLYGAFPTDPYSHTPMHRGAQQPGMTGQVKEDVIVRLKELGVFIKGGKITFHPCLLKKDEFLSQSERFTFLDAYGNDLSFEVNPGQLFFSYCQVPIIYTKSNSSKIKVEFFQGSPEEWEGQALTEELSQSIFQREGKIRQLIVHVNQKILK